MKSSHPFPRLAILLLAFAWAAGASPTVAGSAERGPRFLTGPTQGSAREIALAYLEKNRGALGVTASTLGEVVVTSEYTSAHNGVTHIYLRQQIGGIEVMGTEVNVNVARDGSVMNVGGAFLPALASAARAAAPALDATQALAAAARHLRLTPAGTPEVASRPGGAAAAQVLRDPGLSPDDIPARLVYQPVAGGDVRLAWQVEIEEAGGEHWWNVKVDAETGEVLDTFDYVIHDAWGQPGEAAAQKPAPAAPPRTAAAVTSTDAYHVFALPKESPYDGDRTLVTAPSDALASPFRWHDTDGLDGAELTITRGNNVHAYTDLNADNVADPDSSPDGGSDLVFDFPLDLTLDPSTYRPATVTNLFYWNNVVHDVFYRYGFNEVAGNFQVNSYGRGGLGADDVRAEAQDGSGTNNANFGTPVDGFRPRMQMFIWTGGLPNVVTVNAGPVAGDYGASTAAFGPPLAATGPITADVFVAADGTPPASDGCEPLVGFPAGGIAIVDRGTCTFVVKVANAQAAGAVGVVVANNVAGAPITMGGADPTITIPSVMITLAHGTLLKANAPFNGTLQVNPNAPPPRDSDLDAGVIAHEYGHGISNRLTGGPAVVNCLNNAEQMGEGWSDFTGLVVTTKPEHTATTSRGIGNYVSFRPADGPGIRPAPYTTDMTVNPVTYGAIGGLAIPHGVGYAWASTLWEVYWNLVAKHGYNPDVYGSWTTGGNNLAIQLVVDGMKLQVCRPGFVDGRNAILLADQTLTGGANQCLIWKGFAKRGLGHSALQGLSSSTTDGTQAFDLPPLCQAGVTVAPASLSATVEVNGSASQPLSLTNTSAADGTDLEWTITEAAESCDTPSDLPWVSVAPSSGTTAGAASSTASVTLDAAGLGVGTYTGKLCIASNAAASPVVEVPLSLIVIYDFHGFFFPVANPPAVNTLHAGLPVLLRFSLRGNFGTDILAPGSPSWQQIDCATGAPLGASEPATSLTGLFFIPIVHQYWDVLRTRHAWRGTCRRLTLTLDDATSHPALFRFR